MRAMTVPDGYKYLGTIVSAGETTGSTVVDSKGLKSSRKLPESLR